MGVMTRDLFPMALARIAMESVDLVFEDSTPLPDGSYNVVPTTSPYMARVTDLTPDQYQRLKDGGIIIHSGANVAVPYMLPAAPDSIIYQGSTYKVMESTIAEGVSVFVVDKGAIGFSGVDVNA